MLLLVSALCSGCDNQQQGNIQWQLPLQAPEDAHTSSMNAPLPDWAKSKQGNVELVFLHKNTARKTLVSVVKGMPEHFSIWKVRVLGLAQGLRIKDGALLDDKNLHNAAAFVELIKNDKLVYKGWLYKDFPELFGLDDPSWKVWLKKVSIQADLLERNEKTGSLSSAG